MYIIIGFLWQYIRNPKAIIALSIFVALISFYRIIPLPIFIALMAIYVLGLIIYGIYWLIKRKRQIQHGDALADAIEKDSSNRYAEVDAVQAQAQQAVKEKDKNKEELHLIQQQIKASVQLIRKSKLGDKNGKAALYELPWYMVIGNPAAGKSSAIYNSGLKFPFEESHQNMISAGLSGTRNCDWFFSTEGVLLDTAGRYSVYSDDHSEWLGFLKLLKKHRDKTPINGLLIVVSTAELMSQSPDKTVQLAKNLRSRIQDLTERLEIYAPVYVIFSKMDLIAGFSSFFECYEGSEVDQVWGATLPYEQQSTHNAADLFEQHYQLLYEGLKSVSTTYLSRRHAKNISPSIMTFPLEFKNLKQVLKTFIQTLFEDNPYQFKPIFRGFYFSSALQQGLVESPMTAQIAQQFNLAQSQQMMTPDRDVPMTQHSYFLKRLFSHVILKDRNLVKQHINAKRKQQRYLGFIFALMVVAVTLGLWLWSYRNNQQLILDVQSDLKQVSEIQQAKPDLSGQLDALLILQKRLQRLDEYDQDRPLKFSFGLYQGAALTEKLRAEYFNGIKQIILLPAQQNMAQYLQQVKQNEQILKANHSNVQIQQASQQGQQYLQASATNPQDAYNALKAYLMLSNHQYIEAGHLADQVTRFWRTWLEANRGQHNNAEMVQKAEQILTYLSTLSADAHFPTLESDPQLVDQSRQVLVSVVRGMSARDRVFNEIKMRAAVRFPALTVGQVVGENHRSVVYGSYALPGMFTKKAWDEYVSEAIETAANQPTDTRDWVLNTKQSDDLSFSASPEQIRQQLTLVYKQEYIAHWKKFLDAVHYVKASNFPQDVKNMDVLGEAKNSPIRLLVERVAQETSWDNPVVQAELAAEQGGFIAWFKRTILRQGSNKATAQAATQVKGELAQAFVVFYQLVRKRDDLQDQSLLDEYLNSLAQVRSKMNDLKNAGDIGPGAVAISKATISDQNSMFNHAQKIVDEKLMLGVNAQDQQRVQKILLQPLTQSFEGLLIPAQEELNKLWLMQVYQPYVQTLSQKYPFNSNATIQASATEIAQVFGENGSISRYVKNYLDPLMNRRGYSLSSKTWKNLGLGLDPQFVADFKTYVAPANGVATGDLAQPAATQATSLQSNFQLFPLPQPQFLSYTIDIDGQRLVFENGLQQWVNFVWPNPGAAPGVRVTAIDLQGQTHTLVDEPGEYGINRFIDSAQRIRTGSNIQMKWVSKLNPQLFITANFRLISGTEGGNRGYNGLKLVERVATNHLTGGVVAAQTAPATTMVSTPPSTPVVPVQP